MFSSCDIDESCYDDCSGTPPRLAKPSDEPPTELLRWLNDNQRKHFLHLWNTAPSHIRRIDFTLDAAGWDPRAIDTLSATLTEYMDNFSSSTLDYGACSLRPF